jgi:hypothetical protein
MKRWFSEITCLIAAIALFATVSGCKKSDSGTVSGMMARTGTIQERPPVELVELTGEAFIRGDGENIDDRTRVAAMLDALRKLARRNAADTASIFNAPETTRTLNEEWNGLKLHAVTTYRMGVVSSDLVEVILTDKKGQLKYTWQIENLDLTRPAKGQGSNIKILQQAMSERGFEFKGNHRLGNDTWCEVVSYRNWGKVG